jgi:hypothetical protein
MERPLRQLDCDRSTIEFLVGEISEGAMLEVVLIIRRLDRQRVIEVVLIIWLGCQQLIVAAITRQLLFTVLVLFGEDLTQQLAAKVNGFGHRRVIAKAPRGAFLDTFHEELGIILEIILEIILARKLHRGHAQ